MKKVLKKSAVLVMIFAMVLSAAIPAAAATKTKTIHLKKNTTTVSTSLTAGEKLKLTVKSGTKTVKASKATFKSSEKSVATVSKKGVITAKKAGMATITIKANKKTARLKLTVKNKAAPTPAPQPTPPPRPTPMPQQAPQPMLTPQPALTPQPMPTPQPTPTPEPTPQPTVYTISFNAGDGFGEMSDSYVTGGTLFTLPDCTFTAPEGKVFDRWDRGAAGEQISVTENLTLTALWKYKEIDSGISVSKYGNVILTVTMDSFKEQGYEPGDVIDVQVGAKTIRMPIGTAYSDVDSGNPVCYFNEGKNQVSLAVNSGNFAVASGMAAEIKVITEDPGFAVIWNDGFSESTMIHISMAEKEGYLQDYLLRHLPARSDNREDYRGTTNLPNLTDPEYANFRAVNTTGMGKGALYRSSSPIDPSLNRNKEADAQISENHIRTIMNMTDEENSMKEYAGYDQTNYAGCDVIPLSMGMDFFEEDFRGKFAEGIRFMLEKEGPYLIHCREGKDRTGFALGVLESLMGASVDEIVKDYMITYYNYYGVTTDFAQYERIAETNIKASLAKAFGLNQLEDAGTELSAYAAMYLEGIGLNAEEISALKERLGRNYTE